MNSYWQKTDKELSAQFVFKDFEQAFQFMTAIAKVAEEQNHHPWWSNVWNQVEIRLSTHDAGNTVTEKDLQLAQAIDRIYKEINTL
jgi:4a-hydroxytetrahydrobiopterin dehydratase